MLVGRKIGSCVSLAFPDLNECAEKRLNKYGDTDNKY